MQKMLLMLLFFWSMFTALAQDSLVNNRPGVEAGMGLDSSLQRISDTALLREKGATNQWAALLMENKAFNLSKPPEVYPQPPHRWESKSPLFYYLLAISLFLALQRSLFEKYFSNLFSLFFNLTIRRNQLRDQLMQARLPGLLLNLFFVLVYGLVTFFLANYYIGMIESEWRMIFICTLTIATIYLVKFGVLKFMGWLTGYANELSNYSFIVFLINKLTALLLLPVVMLLAFSENNLTTVGVVISIIILIISFFIRFLKGWNIVGSRIKLSAFHFFIFFVTIEMLPLALLYKFATNYLISSM